MKFKDFLQSKWFIVALVVLVIGAAIVINISLRSGSPNQSTPVDHNQSEPLAGASIAPESDSKKGYDVPANDGADGSMNPDNWPSDWPALPSGKATEGAPPVDDHAHGEEDYAIPTETQEPEDKLPDDYVDDIPHVDEHGKTEEPAEKNAVFPDYTKDLDGFAKAYANPSLPAKDWHAAIKKWGTQNLVNGLEGVNPRDLRWKKGEVTIDGPSDNSSGRVSFHILVDGTPVAKCFAQYQDIWRVNQITSPDF